MTKIINKETLWNGKHLKAVLYEYGNSKSPKLRWEAFSRLNCYGIVAIVPITKDGEVIVIKQFRPPVEKYVVEFPAGLNDRSESLIDVAKRELLEETGYKAQTIKEIAIGPLSAGASTEVLTLYLATGLIPVSEQKLDLEEEIEIFKLPFDKFYDHVYKLENENTYIDLKLYGLFELAKKHL
ncbi:MAG: NUDIX hydrolase [Candidatus Magnetoovum sp. WYHC-5]|nr:NUDIX hydrolase [Candidatus Magnetoovum sp. WYHC-5]